MAGEPPNSSAAARVRATIASGRVAMTEFPLPFKLAWHLRGMENLLMDFLAHPEFAHALYDRLYATYSALYDRLEPLF